MTCDTLTRCPRCLAPLIVCCFHRGGVTEPRTTRVECVRCDHVAERTEAEGEA